MSAPNSTAWPRSEAVLGDDVAGLDGARDLLRQWSRGIRPDPDLTVSEWADRHRWLSSRASAEPGRYRTARTPYIDAGQIRGLPHVAPAMVWLFLLDQYDDAELDRKKTAAIRWA